MLIVQKYGGSSLADSRRILKAARQAAEEVWAGNQVVVVVSAQGATTDRMMSIAEEVNPHPTPRELDAYLSAGEQMTAGLMALGLQALGVPGVCLSGWQAGLLTDDVHGNARVKGLCNDRIIRELEHGNVVVVTGFQGISPQGNLTTLGRGGSDTTAVALAAFLKADRCRIYTDVEGVYDRDPRRFPDAVKFNRVSYKKMLELCRQGAQVLHDRSVELAEAYGVEVEVLSTFRGGPGTVVCADMD